MQANRFLTRGVRAGAFALALWATSHVVLATMPPAASPRTHTVHSPDGTTNSLGQSVSASATYAITPDSIHLTLTNTTKNYTSPQQSLRGFSFRINKKDIKADLGKTAAKLRIISGDRLFDSKELEETRWKLIVDGNKITVYAPSDRYGIMPEKIELATAEGDIASTRYNPYLAGSARIQILLPDISLTDDLRDIEFYFKDETGAGDFSGKLTASVAGNKPDGPGGQEGEQIVVPPGTDRPPGGNFGNGNTNNTNSNNGPPGGPPGIGGGGGGGTSTTPINDTPTTPPITPPTDTTPQTPPIGPEVLPRPQDPNPPSDVIDPPPPPGAREEIPEPATALLLGLGALCLLQRRR